MNNEKLSEMPHSRQCEECSRQFNHIEQHYGLNKLEHFAGLAMQGLLSSLGQHDVTYYDEIASDAVMAAKALLKQLEGESNE